MSVKGVFKKLLGKEFITKLGQDNILEMSASLSFYSALSLAPLLVLLLTFISLIHDSIHQQLLVQVQNLVGPEASKTIHEIAANVNQRPGIRTWAGALGLFTFLFSAGAIFGALRSSLNKIFQVQQGNKKQSGGSVLGATWSFIQQKVFNMGMVLTFVLISIVSLIISSVLSMYLTGTEALVGHVLNFIVSILIFWCLFSAIYLFLPQTKIKKKIAFSSGFVTAVLFSIGKGLIGYYLGKSAASSLYGAAGSLIVLLLWVYYSSAVIFVSAEIAFEINSEEAPA